MVFELECEQNTNKKRLFRVFVLTIRNQLEYIKCLMIFVLKISSSAYNGEVYFSIHYL